MIEIKNGNYKAETSSGYVLLDVWSPSCPPCVKMAPILEEIAKENTSIKIVKMNAHDGDDNLTAAIDLGVRGIPAFFLFKDGKIVAQWVGFKSKAEVLKVIESNANV